MGWGLAAFGPQVPTEEDLDRGDFDIVDQLGRIDSPMLVCVAALEPVTPGAAAGEIVDALPEGIAQLGVVDAAGHFSWEAAPDRSWSVIMDFVSSVAGSGRDEALA